MLRNLVAFALYFVLLYFWVYEQSSLTKPLVTAIVILSLMMIMDWIEIARQKRRFEKVGEKD